MPAATVEAPTVALSFANNFWGKDDAGVVPLLDRMHAAKQTSDELRSFYNGRASIEDEYARKLLSLCRKSLGTNETGSLKGSLDTVRGEVEAMARQHQNIAAQMKTELEEPLTAFAGGMKERRKIIQNGVERLLKVKIQQTQHVNKTRDRYEQECLKIKGYLAQGHMVMGQEERKNKAKLEKTQISLAASNTEYENAVKALEETTARWNREWKAAADKFQDLEEERLDFTKSSLWTFANISSTVCVSDDASCEKIRLSLEKMDVEQDIATFITERGTGQEIPDPPKYINFCRGDVNDTQSDTSEDENYSVAQFPRSINPAFRTSSPQPSTYESHHDPNSALAYDLGHGRPSSPPSQDHIQTPTKATTAAVPPAQPDRQRQGSFQSAQQGRVAHDISQHGPFAQVPHDPYPMDGMTMLCRTGPSSDMSSQPASARPSSRESRSDYSNPTSFSNHEAQSTQASPVKQDPPPGAQEKESKVLKKRSGFFQNHSPFRRKSNKDVQAQNTNRNTWHASNGQSGQASMASPRRPQLFASDQGQQRQLVGRSHSPEPIDANATLALGVGPNVLPVSGSDTNRADNPTKGAGLSGQAAQDDSDPIALALAELKGVAGGKQSSVRMSADNYHGLSTPAPGSQPRLGSSAVTAAIAGTPPPSYDQQVQRLGVPPSAHTAKAMKETSQRFAGQTRSMFGEAGQYSSQSLSRPGTRGHDVPRAASPAPPRSLSPRPTSRAGSGAGSALGQSNDRSVYRHSYRSASPNPSIGGSQRAPSQLSMAPKRGSDHGQYRHGSPIDSARAISPSPYRDYGRPGTSNASGHDMAVQLAGASDDMYGSQRGRNGGRPGTSSGSRAVGLFEGAGSAQSGSRQRSKSVADPSRQFTRDGRPIMHFARALYMYQAAIPEELGFSKGDVLAILRHQDDGWWEAEVHGGNGRIGLVPSNYLQPC